MNAPVLKDPPPPAPVAPVEAAPVAAIAFSLFGGRATWGKAGFVHDGKETVWIEDALPQGAIPMASGGDAWTWVTDPPPFSGHASHQSALSTNGHQHLFNAATPMPFKGGSTLFAYVYLDPEHPPSQVMLQWNQNGVWDHRAYWGVDKLGWESHAMGPLPPLGSWVRLEVPSAAVNLDQPSTLRVKPAQPDTDGPVTLNLEGYKLTFSEDFDAPLDVSPWGPGTRWIAHTPWDGDFGDAAFADPRPGFPFTIEKGVLRIEARKDEAFAAEDKFKRPWRAGLLSSYDAKGKGFAQQYGYFVMRAKLPTGRGVWPAFWLCSCYDRGDTVAGATGSIEIDVLEYYGAPDTYSATLHIWQPQPHRAEGFPVYTKPGMVADGFHDYGVLVDPQWITMYTDGVAVWRVRTPPEHNKPLGILVNLALGGGWPIDKVESPCFMEVEHVRAYAK